MKLLVPSELKCIAIQIICNYLYSYSLNRSCIVSDARTLEVSPGMFRTYDAEILAGRAFDDADLNGEATPVVVNRRFVEMSKG